MDKKYAIFDFDGTLADSMPYWQNAKSEFLAEYGITENTKAILEKTKPMPIKDAVQCMIDAYGIEGASAERGAQRITDTMSAHYRLDVPLKSSAREYLALLKHRGVRMTIVSATARELVEQCLKRLDALDYFDFIISCIDIGKGKDYPDAYYAAQRQFGANSPSEVAVFEDSIDAMHTVLKAGFYSVAVYDADAKAHWDELRAVSDENIASWREAVVTVAESDSFEKKDL